MLDTCCRYVNGLTRDWHASASGSSPMEAMLTHLHHEDIAVIVLASMFFVVVWEEVRLPPWRRCRVADCSSGPVFDRRRVLASSLRRE